MVPPVFPKLNGANGHGPSRWDDAAIQPAGPREKNPANRDRPCVNGYFLDYTFECCFGTRQNQPRRIPRRLEAGRRVAERRHRTRHDQGRHRTMRRMGKLSPAPHIGLLRQAGARTARFPLTGMCR